MSVSFADGNGAEYEGTHMCLDSPVGKVYVPLSGVSVEDGARIRYERHPWIERFELDGIKALQVCCIWQPPADTQDKGDNQKMAANNKRKKEIHFTLTDDDYLAFGRYRIMYTKGGHALVRRQRITYFISGAAIALLFTVFHVDPAFTKLAYAVAAVIGIGGVVFAEKLVLRQQERIIKKTQDTSVESVHPDENIIILGDDELHTKAGSDEQSFAYKDIKLVDLTEESIYVWMSDTMIMPVPLHAFRNMDEMKEVYNGIREKIKEQGGDIGEE